MQQLEKSGSDCCPAGIGIVRGDGQILHICPNGNSALVHRHSSARVLGFLWQRPVVQTSDNVPLSDVPRLVRIFFCGGVGIVGGLIVNHDFFSAEMRLFFLTGIAGGFTAFSAFGLETFYLLRRGETLVAGGYVAASVVVGLLVLWGGFVLVSARG
ncbi:MAG: hypothetical protein GXX91_00970 [Verrucomicrobiaceae bacterium]|nr:hypothetical protein [Verrucomicrobiaceae bacterium]